MHNSQNPHKDIILKTKSWQSMHSGFNALKYTVQLLQTPPNAKHEKLTLSIQIISESQQTIYRKQFKTSDLPTQAITIFSDVETLFDYIDENFNDPTRIRFNQDESMFTIVNIVVMKNKQLKQEIVLFLDSETYVLPKQELEEMFIDQREFLNESQVSAISSKQLLEESKVLIDALIKDNNAQLQEKIAVLTDHLNSFVSEIKTLRNQNKLFSSALNNCNINVAKLQKENILLNEKIDRLERQKANISDIKPQEPHPKTLELHLNVQQIKKQLSDNKWQIDQLDNSLANMIESHMEMQQFKQKVEEQSRNQPKHDHIMPLVNEMRKEIVILSSKVVEMRENTSRLGTKMFINLDTKTNKYINNFINIDNIIEKVAGDQQRHQLLGAQSFNIMQLKTKCYFQIRIINTVNDQVVIGIVGQNRRGQRYSYDKKECVCYDGQGFIFQQGHKIKMPCKFHNGQTIKVVIDPSEALIHWFVGYTEVGSTSIPESMKKMKVLPYFELYCINDKIAING